MTGGDSMSEFATKFMDLFSGLDRAYGKYEITSKRTDGKQNGTAATVKKPVTVELWEKHLDGKQGIGIVPITDRSTCYFGAIDIDVYMGLDLKEIAIKMKELNLPFVPCRSKSGGCHLFLFTKEEVTALLLQTKLKEIASVIGYGDCEIFPKQTNILADRGDIGQWINMPYFDNIRGNRYGVKDNGTPMSMEEFLTFATAHQLTKKELEQLTLSVSDDFEDGPPCIQHLITQGFPEGTRNDGLFNLGVYARMASADHWEQLVESYNIKYMIPPLRSDEVQTVIRSLKKKDYIYTCSKAPVKPYCNSAICRLRKYGVGVNSSMPILTSLTKYNSSPPVWFMDVDGGGRLELSTDDLQNQSRFQKRCMERLNLMPPQINRTAWQQMLQHLLDNVVIIDAPVDSSAKGQLIEYLEKFCTGRAQARSKDELLLGKPWLENKKHYFRMSDFMAFLERNHFKEFKVNQIAAIFKDKGAQHHFFILKGKGVNCWAFPQFAEQIEAHDPPDMGKGVPY
jgi:hypothetical protein